MVGINGDIVDYRAFFELDVQAALESDVIVCEHNVLEEKKIVTPVLKASALESKFSLLTGSKKKNDALAKSGNILTSGRVDLTAHISNSDIASIKSGAPAIRKKTVKLTNGKDGLAVSVVKQTSSLGDDVNRDDRLNLSYRSDLLYRDEKDPAAVINAAPFHIPVSTVIGGLRKIGDIAALDKKAIQFRKSFSLSGRSSAKVKLEESTSKTIEIPFYFSLNRSKVGNYTVEMNAIQRGQTLLQSAKLNVNISEVSLDPFSIPTVAPILNVGRTIGGRMVKVLQLDQHASYIDIFRRNASIQSERTQDAFEKIASLSVTYGVQAQFIDTSQQTGKFIYRAVATDSVGRTAGVFSSVIVPAAHGENKKRCPDTLSLIAYESDGAITINVYNIPNDIIAIQLVRKNLTTHESNFSSPNTIVNGPIRSIDRATADLQFQDMPNRPDTVYEYKCMLIDAFGVRRESSRNSILRYSGDAQSQGSHTIIAQQINSVTDQTSRVSFQLDAPTDQSSLDIIYSVLTSAGLEAQYLDEIKQNREQFSSLVAFEVLRFDTTSGLNESFGVVTPGLFEDSTTARETANVSALIPGRKYIYQFRLLLRLASSLFHGVTVSSSDLETSKTYNINVKKFTSPAVLKKGTLASNIAQQKSTNSQSASSTGNSDMIEGRTSLSSQLTVQIPDRDTQLSDIVAVGSYLGNIIRWNVSQGSQNIDHIIVFADYNGNLAPLEAVQYCGSTSMVYLDNKLGASINEVLYYIMPVFTDLTQGAMLGPAEV